MRVAQGLFFVLVVAACGDDGVNRIPDNPPPDGMMDAEGQAVTLTITDGTTPRRDVVVLFQNADSTLVARVLTNENGVASTRMAAGGFVTAINPFGLNNPTAVNGSELRTFAGVKPGDQLRLHRNEDDLPQIDVTLIVPLDPTASSYQLSTNCGGQDITNGSGSGGSGSGTPGGTVSLYGCGSTIDLIIETRDGNFVPLNAIVRKDVPVTAGGMIDLTDATYAPAVDQTFAYQNVAAGVMTVNLTHSLLTAKGHLHSVSGGSDLVAGATELTLRRPDVAGATALTTTELYGGGLGRFTVVDWGAPGPYAFDGASALLREYASAPEFDHHEHKLSWTSSAGEAPDLAVAEMSFRRPDGKTTELWSWRIAGAYAGDSLVFPLLPSTEAELNPTANDTPSIEELYTMKTPGGYDAIRANVHSMESPAVTGASGRVLVEDYDGGGVGAELRRARSGARMFSAPVRRRAR